MLTDNTYLQGLILNNNEYSNLEEAKNYIDTMLGYYIEPPDDKGEYSDNIIFLKDYSGIFFKTRIINGEELTDTYSKIQFSYGENNNKLRKNIYVYHFFEDYNDDNEDDFNQLILYKYISNVENIIRLLIAFSYCISPNLPYPKKSNIIYANDIDKYYKQFLDFKDKQLKFNNFVKIDKIIEKIKKFSDEKYFHEIRGAIAHNKIYTKYGENFKSVDILDYKNHIKEYKIKYSEFNDLLEDLKKIQ